MLIQNPTAKKSGNNVAYYTNADSVFLPDGDNLTKELSDYVKNAIECKKHVVPDKYRYNELFNNKSQVNSAETVLWEGSVYDLTWNTDHKDGDIKLSDRIANYDYIQFYFRHNHNEHQSVTLYKYESSLFSKENLDKFQNDVKNEFMQIHFTTILDTLPFNTNYLQAHIAMHELEFRAFINDDTNMDSLDIWSNAQVIIVMDTQSNKVYRSSIGYNSSAKFELVKITGLKLNNNNIKEELGYSEDNRWKGLFFKKQYDTDSLEEYFGDDSHIGKFQEKEYESASNMVSDMFSDLDEKINYVIDGKVPMVLKSPNGNRFNLVIDNNGKLGTLSLSGCTIPAHSYKEYEPNFDKSKLDLSTK